MSITGDRILARYEADPENWTTVRCVHCGEKFSALKSGIYYGEPSWCWECKARLFGGD